MKIKVSEASHHVLDYMVAKAEGLSVFKSGAGPSAKMVYIPKGKRSYYKYEPTVNWKQGGPIIERETIAVVPAHDGWQAVIDLDEGDCMVQTNHGPTPLIAVMRCYVASKLGTEVEVPNELV